MLENSVIGCLVQLQINDQDPDVRVTILRGSGSSFCAGYDLDMKRNVPMPIFEAEGEGMFMRHVLQGRTKAGTLLFV